MLPLLIVFFVGCFVGLIFGLSVGFCLAAKGLLTREEYKLFWAIFWESFRLQWKPHRQGKGE